MKRKNQSAHGLAVVLIVMTALAALVAAAIQYTQGLNRYANRSRSNVAAQAIGDGCLDLAFSQWRQICRNTLSTCNTVSCNKLNPPPTNAFAGIQLPTQAMFPDVPNFTATAANDQTFTVSNYKVQLVDDKITLTSTDPPVSSVAPTAEASGVSGTYAPGGGMIYVYYLASCDVTLPSPAGPVTTKMRRIFEKKKHTPFMYFMFFNDDLELNASSPLTIYGAIHTNGKLYTGTSNLTLTATQPSIYGSGTMYGNAACITPTRGVSYADDWIVGFKPGDTIHPGPATAPTIISSIPPSREPNTQVYDWDPTAWNATDADTTNDSPHEITELPPASGTDFMAKSIWNQAFGADMTAYAKSVQRISKDAAIRINIDANDVVTIFGKDINGNEVALNETMTGPGTDSTVGNYYGYQWAYKQWIAALGVNTSGQYLPARTATNGKTTNNSTTLTVAAAAPMNFATTDVGRVITGAGIPAGTTITARASTTSVTLSKHATAAGTNVSITVGGPLLGGTIPPLFPSIQDNREGALIDLVDIDFNAFKNWNPQTAFADFRRLQGMFGLSGFHTYIHADPRAANPGRKRAIRIKNCGSLWQTNADPDAGFFPTTDVVPLGSGQFLITDNPVYIWGDFATGRTLANAASVPPCNKPAATAVELATVIEQSASALNGTPRIVADAVTLLSNNWVDDAAHLSGPLSGRIASNTTVNANIVAGNVPTSVTNGYSGGGENFIRLLEDWSGQRFSFVGSMVQLYQSKTATGKWVPPGTAGNVYNEPTRNWYWLNFNWSNGMGSDLYTISYRKHKWSPAP